MNRVKRQHQIGTLQRASRSAGKRLRAIFGLIVAPTCLMFSARAMAIVGFDETFADDPVATSRWTVHDGDAARFEYNAATHTLLAHYDTLKPTARLIRTLCRPMTSTDSFEFKADFRMRSIGFVADPRRNAQIAFGLMNTAFTGSDRVYGRNGQGAFDVVSFDYFPNVSNFGGPSAGATLINRDTGTSFAAAIDFAFGPETQLNDPGESALPLDTWLTAVVSYRGPQREARLRILSDGAPLPINAVGDDYEPGGTDDDPSTIVTRLTGAGFRADSFAILLWRDTSATFSSVVADVDFRRITMTWTGGGDFDQDGDIDAADMAHFRACMTAPAVPQRDPACTDADLDCDGDVDQEDFGQLQTGITSQP